VAAYEMARQLVEAGERVALLALFDRPAPVFGPSPDEDADDRLDDPQVFVKVARELAEGYARQLPIDFGHFGKLDAEGQMAYVLAQAKAAGLLPEEFELPQMQRLLRGYRSRVRAVNSYKPHRYRGRLTLFRAGEVDAADINPALLELIRRDETMGWGQFVTEPLEIIQVPGTHGTMVQEPHVQALAEKLRACIARAEAE
jgi:thioesterase domain-containing protein